MGEMVIKGPLPRRVTTPDGLLTELDYGEVDG